jgi:DNA-binding MarR family transcriptional regulator
MTKQQYIEQLFNTMGQLRKLLESQAQESHEERAATMMQYAALKSLKGNEKSTVGDIAVQLKLSKSSATQLIERLVKADLVERFHDQKDRRIVRVAITSAGEQKMLELRKKFIHKMSKIFSKIPDADLKKLVRIHANLITTLQKEQNK